jgi:hypothetical protein
LSIQSLSHPENIIVIQEDLALIISPTCNTCSEGRIFLELLCKRYNLEYIGYKEKIFQLYGFCVRSKNINNQTSIASK